MYIIREFLATYSNFQVTSGQMTSLLGNFWSPEITWRHFLLRDCILLRAKPCRKWNVHYTQVFGLSLPLPGYIRWNDVTSWSLPVSWNHVMPFSVTWLPPTASYS